MSGLSGKLSGQISTFLYLRSFVFSVFFFFLARRKKTDCPDILCRVALKEWSNKASVFFVAQKYWRWFEKRKKQRKLIFCENHSFFCFQPFYYHFEFCFYTLLYIDLTQCQRAMFLSFDIERREKTLLLHGATPGAGSSWN